MMIHPIIVLREAKVQFKSTRALPTSTRLIQREQSLREKVARSLAVQLFSGQREPGSTFSVPMLADEFGVSATPVREAVLELVQHGLLEVMPAKGYRVVQPSADEIRETVEVRRLLEIPTTIRAAELATRAELEDLRAVAEETVELARERNTVEFCLLDHDFHVRVLRLAGNDTMVQHIEDLRNRARIFLASLVKNGLWSEEIAMEHVHLIDAMIRRDLDEVERMVLQHMSYSLAAAL